MRTTTFSRMKLSVRADAAATGWCRFVSLNVVRAVTLMVMMSVMAMMPTNANQARRGLCRGDGTPGG